MGERTKEQDKWHERGFAVGVCVSAAILAGTFGADVEAEEILGAAGITTRAKAKRLGVDNYDLDQLKGIFKTMRRSAEYGKRIAKARREAADRPTTHKGERG